MFFSGKATSDMVWKQQLTSLSGDEWKDVRSTFSPIFTSGKMKSMMTFIHHVTERLMTAVDQKAAKGEEIELKEYFGKFTMDSIASCAFGVEANSFTDPNSEFVKNASDIFRYIRPYEDVIITKDESMYLIPRYVANFKATLPLMRESRVRTVS